jgi:hydrocephalus-inducing protein
MISDFTFTPATGHLHAGASKIITVTFHPTQPIQILDQEIHLSLYNIEFPRGIEMPSNWDSPIHDLAMIALVGNSGSGKDPKETKDGKAEAKGGGKPNPKVKNTSSIIGSKEKPLTTPPPLGLKDGPIEPLHEIINGSNKAFRLKLHAIVDTARYECNCKSIQFKTTMMYQTRVYSFTVKNLSSTVLPLRWQVLMSDMSLPKDEIYFVHSAPKVKPNKIERIIVNFCPNEGF